MKKVLANLTVLFFSSLLGLIGLIEFNYKLRQPISEKKVNNTKLPQHYKNIHFCTKNRKKAISDEKRVYIPSPNSELFFYMKNDVFLKSHDVNGHRINQSNLSNYKEQKSEEIWVFGDSFTYGHAADNTETIPSFLSILNNENINFKNFAVNGYGSLNSLLTFKWALDTYKDKLPKKVIFIAHTNDLWDDPRTQNRLDSRAKLTEELDFIKRLKYFSRNFKLFKSIVNYYRSRRDTLFLTINKFNKVYKDKQINDFDSSLTEQTLIEFIDVAKNFQIDLYFFFIPGRALDGNNEYTNDYLNSKIYNSLLLKISKENNIPYTNINDDLLEKNIKSINYKSPPNLYAIDGHYSEYGNFVAAKTIANSLMKNSKIDFKLNAPFENKTKYIFGSEECPN